MIEEHPRAPAPLPADAARDRLAQRSSTIVFPLPIDLLTALPRRSGDRTLSGRAPHRPALGPRGRPRARPGRRPGAGRADVEPPTADELERVPVLRGPRGPHAARAFAVAAAGASRHPGLAGARRAEPLPGVRASGGRRPHAAARALVRRAGRRRDRARRRGLAARAGGRARSGFAYLHALLNEGRAAGASLPHTHSQLVWLREPPPAVAGGTSRGDCGVCELVAAARASIAERDGLVVLARRPAGSPTSC